MTNTPERDKQPGNAASDPAAHAAVEPWVQVFFGEATETGCRIYAQNQRPSQAAVPLSGFVRGPFCQYAHTLPVSYSFRQGTLPGGTVEAWVPDPCFWTPAMPFYYEYTLERDFGDRREQVHGTIGIRRLGCEGSNLRFDGKRWVLRAARADELQQPADLAAFHEASLAALIPWPGPVSLGAATRAGVLLVVELSPLADVEQALRSLRDEAAVAIVILDRREAPLDPRSDARNLLFAQRFAPGQPIRPEAWADIALCELRRGEPWVENISARRVPLVAVQPGGKGIFPQSGRALCDLLQRDLAESGTNWAGYIV